MQSASGQQYYCGWVVVWVMSVTLLVSPGMQAALPGPGWSVIA